MKKDFTKMSHEELLVNLESLVIRFVKEDDMGYNTDKTNEQIETVKDEILSAKENYIKTFSSTWTVDDLNFSSKTVATLKKNRVHTLEDVLNISEDSISQMKGITIAVRRDINSVKECFGYELI